MISSKNIITFLFSLFVFISTNGFANSIGASQTHTTQKEASGLISQSSNSNHDINIASIDGMLQTLIKSNTRTGPGFQNFKNSKRSFILHHSLLSFQFSKSYYSIYCLSRINTICVSPFYIAYHRLII